jgi:hypothetical protein
MVSISKLGKSLVAPFLYFAVVGTAPADNLTFVEPAAPAALSDFQWAVLNGAELMLVPVGDYYYLARRSNADLIETLPLKIEVELYRMSGEVAGHHTIPVSEMMSPRDVSPDVWIMEMVDGESWTVMKAYVFYRTAFYALGDSNVFEYVEPGNLRFHRR